ncbi:hypothetical protein HUJ04_005686 [Dendroctonus ponderosae]|nr:hypothetical protein HUJ04_005686 [Dendroctonus ponderosae]
MTLSLALLIASFQDRELLDDLSAAAPGKNHHSFDWGDSSKKSSPTSDLGSEISTTPSDANLIWVDKYSFFSQNDSDGPQSVDDMAEASVARYVSMLMDMVENATMRFNNSYAFSHDEVKIFYENRDILDLGANLTGAFPLTHPARNQQALTKRSPLEIWPLDSTTPNLHSPNNDSLLE